MKDKLFDVLGMGLSGLCIIHCIVLPLVVLLYPAANFTENHLIHDLIFVLIVLAALLAFLPHAIKEKSYKLLVLPVIGVVLMIVSNSIFHHEKSSINLILSLVGSLCLIVAHYKHFQAKNCCEKNH